MNLVLDDSDLEPEPEPVVFACKYDGGDSEFDSAAKLKYHKRVKHRQVVTVNEDQDSISRNSDNQFSCRCGKSYDSPTVFLTHARLCEEFENPVVFELQKLDRGQGGVVPHGLEFVLQMLSQSVTTRGFTS